MGRGEPAKAGAMKKQGKILGTYKRTPRSKVVAQEPLGVYAGTKRGLVPMEEDGNGDGEPRKKLKGDGKLSEHIEAGLTNQPSGNQ